MPNPDIHKWASAGGRALRGRPQSPEHVAKRSESTRATLAKTPRKCKRCGELFIRTMPSQKFCSGRCWQANEKAKPHKQATARAIRRRRLNETEYARLVGEHGMLCMICGTTNGKHRLAVDHDHERGTIRGLLCHRCNTGLGMYQDDPDRLEAAARYLRERN